MFIGYNVSIRLLESIGTHQIRVAHDLGNFRFHFLKAIEAWLSTARSLHASYQLVGTESRLNFNIASCCLVALAA